MSFLDAMTWRYATKKMDPSRRVTKDKVETILEAIRLSPSSSGLQPFHVFVITNQALKDQIVPIASGQSQVADCSHLIVSRHGTHIRPSASINHSITRLRNAAWERMSALKIIARV